MSEMKGRFAPSPTGRMHLGNVYAALLSWLSARSQGGAWVLRIEDLDPQRSKMEFAKQIEDDLRWLGLNWDEGGLASAKSHKKEDSFVQSERGEIYEKYLKILEEHHLTYPCFCSRADILATQAPHESDGRIVYAGTCRGKKIENSRRQPATRPPATRLIVPDKEIAFVDLHYGKQSVNLARHCGDFILRRGDGAWAYQLAVVVDDALMGITEVVRGRDLLLSSPQQIFLHNLLGFTSPQFAHFPLLCNSSGQRLCKRDKNLDLGEIRKTGITPEKIIGKLAFWSKLIDREEPVLPQELISEFAWQKIPKNDIIVDCDM